jgi:branched-chain amino acid transport system ATP-binding protein
MTVNKGDFITILGANGAGKSSTLNAISGVAPIYRGEINFKGERINGLSPRSIAAKGIIQIPEGRKLFPLMTVRENLEMGAFLRKDTKQIANSLDKLTVNCMPRPGN